MKTLIIEDEAQAVIALEQEIKTHCPDLELFGSAGSIDEAYELIHTVKPELLFLDIQLKDGNGFDLLTKIGSYSFKVIFTTAYGEYALKAIKISALDYLLKPVDSQELVEAVAKAKAITAEATQTQLDNFIQNESLQNPRKKIALQTAKGVFLYEMEHIIRLQSDGNYTTLFLREDKRITVAKTLKEFEEMLGTYGFIRIHHSHIINLNHLESYINKDGGYVVMNNKNTLPVSKRKKSDLLAALHKI